MEYDVVDEILECSSISTGGGNVEYSLEEDLVLIVDFVVLKSRKQLQKRFQCGQVDDVMDVHYTNLVNNIIIAVIKLLTSWNFNVIIIKHGAHNIVQVLGIQWIIRDSSGGAVSQPSENRELP